MPFLRYPMAALTALAVLLALAAFWPTGRERASGVSAPIAEDGLAMTIDLDAPTSLRLGTTEVIHLTTQLAASSPTVTLPAGTQTVVTVDSACLAVDPPGETLQAAIVGQIQGWVWELSPRDSATGPCEVDLVVRLRHDTNERIVWVKQLQIATTSVMGLPAPTAQAAGLTGSVLGFIALAILQLKSRPSRKTK